jgi:short-subunit dehydrogenase
MPEVVVVASSSLDTASALARRLAAQGARVAVLAATRKELPEIARSVVQAGASAVLAIPCELTDPDDVMAAAARVERELGPIDRWVNTAMTDLRFVNATRAAVSMMRMRERGLVVQVGAPKAIRIYSDALQAELRVAGSGVHVDSVRTYPYRRAGAAIAAAASVVGAVLLRRIFR